MAKKVLMLIAGLNGTVGSTLSVGPAGVNFDSSVHLGMLTESKLIKQMNLDLPPLDSIRIDGWDLNGDNLHNPPPAHCFCAWRCPVPARLTFPVT